MTVPEEADSRKSSETNDLVINTAYVAVNSESVSKDKSEPTLNNSHHFVMENIIIV